MSLDSTIPDPRDRWRRSFTALNNGDVDSALSIWGPDPVWDMSLFGLGVYEGLAAIRGFWEEWTRTYDEWLAEPEEISALGSEVTLAVVVQEGRPAGSSGAVRLRYAAVAVWARGLVVRITNYPDVEEARAAAERLAEERR